MRYRPVDFTVSLTSLAVMRIFVAAILICDLAYRASGFGAFYSQESMIPFELVGGLMEKNGWWSLHNLPFGNAYLAGLFAAGFAAAFCLLLGIASPFAALVSWLLYVSVQNRGLSMEYPGDYIARTLLFWGVFLPWDRKLSLRRSGREELSDEICLPSTTAYFVMVCVFFMYAGLSKVGVEWKDGSAVHLLMTRVWLRTGIGETLVDFPAFLSIMTISTRYLEILGPWLLLVRLPWDKPLPAITHAPRIGVIFGLSGMLIGIRLFMDTHLLSHYSIAALIGLLPPEFLGEPEDDPQ